MRRLGAVLLVVSSLAIAAHAAHSAAAEDAPNPHWIWQPKDSANAPRFEKAFNVAGAAQSAALRIAADFCRATVEINGSSILVVEPHSPTLDLDVTRHMRTGENRIVVTGERQPGPAAIALSLSVVVGNDTAATIVTDESWSTAAKGKAVSLGAVAPEIWGLNRRSAKIEPFDNYEQWQQALSASENRLPAKFRTAPGFEIAAVRVAGADESSWVSMAFDPQGRITIAREDKGLLRMTLDESRQSVAKVETINDELLECRGLLYAHDALYANANNSKGMYRLRDSDGDGKFDETRLLRTFPGGVGHGRNDLALGPDGMIYSIHGDSVELPTTDVLDRTSPLREARRGQKTSEGYLVRTDRDGKNWELVCGGLRNPFGVAFNPQGDAFTYDADAEFDMGAPWYRPTRIVQLASGADYGWRGVTGKWPPYFPDHPDNALPTLDIGKGSPTALAFGTQSNFPPEYRRAAFVLDWTYGRVLAVHLAPRSAGYRAQAETFLQGRPLNVTDLAFGPDGALYIVTGGRKTQSALYKVSFTGKLSEPAPPTAHEVACAEHAATARALRRRLEELHGRLEALRGRGDPVAIDVSWPHLDSPDPIIRHAARIAIEQLPLDSWRERALAEQRPTAALTALLALARGGEKDDFAAIIERLLQFQMAELEVGQTLSLLQGYTLCMQHVPATLNARKGDVIAQLSPAFAPVDESPLQVSPFGSSIHVRREVARLLGQLEAPSVVQQTVQTLLRSDRQEDRLQGLFALRNMRAGWTLESRRAYFTTLNDAAHFIGGDGMPKFLAKLREESVATLTAAERDALADVLDPKSADADEPLPPSRPVVKAWTTDDFAPLLKDTSRSGDRARGEAVFRDALCARCHRVGARGPAVGPDLTHVAGRFSRQDMLESILTPAKVVAENYRNVQILTKDGRIIVGRVLAEGDYRSQKLRIATDPLAPAKIVEIDKRDIEEHQSSATSPMPNGLLDSFNQQAILDLLAYLEQGPADNAARK